MTFERALKELETIVNRLERGDVELEESIAIYERGEVLKEHCERLLKQAEARSRSSPLPPTAPQRAPSRSIRKAEPRRIVARLPRPSAAALGATSGCGDLAGAHRSRSAHAADLAVVFQR